MIKSQANGENFMSRSASFSTHGSRTGANLLGWGEKEVLTPQQQREALLLRRERLTSEIQAVKEMQKQKLHPKVLAQFAAERADLAKEIAEVDLQLSELRPKKSDRVRPDLGECIIEVVKARMTKPQWAMVMKEAREMYERENGVKPDPGHAR